VESFKLMLENPLVGVGLGMHNLALPERGLGWSGVHSAFLQVGADLGVPGFLVYLLLFRRLFEGLRHSRAQAKGSSGEREFLALATGIETALVAYVVGGFFLPVAYRFYSYYVAGFAVALQEIIKRSNAAFTGGVTATRAQTVSQGADSPPRPPA
jgi:hypothetical protein